MNMGMLTPALIALSIVLSFGVVVQRMRAAAQHERRMDQLKNSQEALAFHVRLLEELLDAPEVPNEVKRMLISFSDMMEDKASVLGFSEALLRRPFDFEEDSADLLEIRNLLADFERAQPHLAGKFSSAVICAAMGAVLRWPETCASFDRLAPRMVVDNGRGELAAAVNATRARGQPDRFGPGQQVLAA